MANGNNANPDAKAQAKVLNPTTDESNAVAMHEGVTNTELKAGTISGGGESSGAGNNSGSSSSKRKKSLREQYMGKTPGKKSKTGREVIARMKEEGKIDKTGTKFMYEGKWYDIRDADMGHKTDAVKWWNKTGRFSGPKSKRVRNFMLSSYNYELQPYWINRSKGAKLKENYLPPV